MKKILYVLLISCVGFTFIISCGDKDEYESWEKYGNKLSEDISISSSASDNATVTFGQSYQYQVTTSGTYSGTITYSLSNHPDGMTISSSGLVEWTPTKASEITTHSNIKIIITTASGYVLTQTYDLTVSGTCTTGNVLSIWTGDQRTSTDSSDLLGNITAYTDNSSDSCSGFGDNSSSCIKTASENYDYRSASVHITHGPEASAEKGSVFFYNQYDNTTHLYFFYMFGKHGNSGGGTVKIDIFTVNNASASSDIVDDDSGETDRISQSESDGLYSSSYTGRYSYNNCCSDGGVIGPFSGSTYRIFVDIGGTSTVNSNTLGMGNLSSFKYFSKDGSTVSLGAVDNFTVGYNTTLDCSN